MWFRLAADLVLLLHLAFILFALFGALLAVRWRWVAGLHLPAAAWGFFVELTGRACPLTDLEDHLRRQAGQLGFRGSFIEHYLQTLIYPEGLTPRIQLVLACVVVVVNVTLYGWLWWRRSRAGPPPA